MKKLMMLALCAFAVTAATAEIRENVHIGNERYTLDTESKTATLTAIWDKTAAKEINISTVETWDGTSYDVTSIGMSAVNGCTGLTSVSFPLVTSIGDFAFENCTGLTSVSIPLATSIGQYAFDCCKGLTSVSFPKVATIGIMAFFSCEGLTSVSFPMATTIDDYAFWNCFQLTSVSIPMATTIDIGAFYKCSKLTSVSFPMATMIAAGAFSSCSLTSVSLPSVTSIGQSAFEGCPLTSVSFPMAITIGDGAFRACSLTSASLLSATSIGQSAFEGCPLSKLIVSTQMKEEIAGNETYYGITGEPTIDGYGVVPKGSVIVPKEQVTPSNCVAVAKETIAAAKAETISIVDGVIQLGISVSSNANITAETSNWGKVKFTTDTKIRLSEDGTQLVISIPVTEKEGFMLLQSGEGKVISSDGSKLFFAD